MERNDVSPAPDLLDPAIQLLRDALDQIGTGRIALATLARGRVCLQPMDLSDGERVARMLGCDLPMDHRLLTPGHTLWTGVRDGLELQVRSRLRGTGGSRW